MQSETPSIGGPSVPALKLNAPKEDQRALTTAKRGMKDSISMFSDESKRPASAGAAGQRTTAVRGDGARLPQLAAATARPAIRGDRLGMGSKAALAPSQLENHITSLMRASFNQLKKRYLASHAEGVLSLATERHGSFFGGTQAAQGAATARNPRSGEQGALTARRTMFRAVDTPRQTIKTPRSAATRNMQAAAAWHGDSPMQLTRRPRTPKAGAKEKASTGLHAGLYIQVPGVAQPSAHADGAAGPLPPAEQAGRDVPNALADTSPVTPKPSSMVSPRLRAIRSMNSAHRTQGNSRSSSPSSSMRREGSRSARGTPSLEITYLASAVKQGRSLSLPGDAAEQAERRRRQAWQPLANTETYVDMDPQAFNSEVRRRALEWRSEQERQFKRKVQVNLQSRIDAEETAYLGRLGIQDTSNPILAGLKKRGRQQAAQRVQHAISFELERRRVNEWDLSGTMVLFANKLRQELKEQRIGEQVAQLRLAQQDGEAQELGGMPLSSIQGGDVMPSSSLKSPGIARPISPGKPSTSLKSARFSGSLSRRPSSLGPPARSGSAKFAALVAAAGSTRQGKQQAAAVAADLAAAPLGRQAQEAARTEEAARQPVPPGPSLSPHSSSTFQAWIAGDHGAARADTAKWSVQSPPVRRPAHFDLQELWNASALEAAPDAAPEQSYLRKCLELHCRPAAAVVSQLHLARLDVSHTPLDSVGVKCLGAAISSSRHLRQLRLADTGLGDVGVLLLLPHLQAASLSLLDLSHNQLTSEPWPQFAEELMKRTSRRRPIAPAAPSSGSADDGASALADAAGGLHASIQVLHVASNNIGSAGLAALEDFLCTAKRLRELNLRHTGQTEESGPSLGRIIDISTSLELLDVSWNLLGPVAAERIAVGLKSGQSLKHLNMCWTSIQDGLSHLAEALQQPRLPLESLSLSRSRLLEKGLLALAVAFHAGVSLKRLDLSQNVVGGVVGQCLLRQLHLHKLQHPTCRWELQGTVEATLERQMVEEAAPATAEKQTKGKGKKAKAKSEDKALPAAGVPVVVEAIGRRFQLDLASEQDRVVLTLLMQHEHEAMQHGGLSWTNVVLDGKLLRARGQPAGDASFSVAQWDSALPSKGRLQLDVLLLPSSACSWLDVDGLLAVGAMQVSAHAAAIEVPAAVNSSSGAAAAPAAQAFHAAEETSEQAGQQLSTSAVIGNELASTAAVAHDPMLNA